MRLGDIFTELSSLFGWLAAGCSVSNSISLTIRLFVRSLTHSLIVLFVLFSLHPIFIYCLLRNAMQPIPIDSVSITFHLSFLFRFHSLPVHSFRFGWLCDVCVCFFSPLFYFLYFCISVSSMSLCSHQPCSFGITTRTHKFVRIYLDILSNSIWFGKIEMFRMGKSNDYVIVSATVSDSAPSVSLWYCCVRKRVYRNYILSPICDGERDSFSRSEHPTRQHLTLAPSETCWMKATNLMARTWL